MGNAAPVDRAVAACWTAIRQADRPLAVEARDIAHLAPIAGDLAAQAPFERRGEGPVDAAVDRLGDLPAALSDDIRDLALRFAGLMGVDTVRIRLEGVTTNACRKVHSDFTDVRLITTYCGLGTDYLPHGRAQSDENLADENLERLPTGFVALFKGRLFADGHEPCLHRSPPIADTGEKRLVLVIDTPLDEAHAQLLRLAPADC